MFRASPYSWYSFLPEVCLLVLIESVYQGQNTESLFFLSELGFAFTGVKGELEAPWGFEVNASL